MIEKYFFENSFAIIFRTRILACLFSCSVLMFFAFPIFSYAENTTNIWEISYVIKNEMIYPKECRYYLPAVLPVKGVSQEKNQEFRRVLEVIEDLKLVDTRTITNGSITIRPKDNNYDIIQSHTSITYELLGINIIIGIWDIELYNIKEDSDKTVAFGKKFIKKEGKLYSQIINVVSDDNDIIRYQKGKFKWTITKKGESVEVIEEYVQ